jgi:hypothetical protein
MKPEDKEKSIKIQLEKARIHGISAFSPPPPLSRSYPAFLSLFVCLPKLPTAKQCEYIDLINSVV